MAQLEVLKHYVKDIWPIIHEAQLPVYLDSTSAKYVPFHSFARLLQVAFESLPPETFIKFVQAGAEGYSQQIRLMCATNNTSWSLDLLGDYLPIRSAEFKSSVQGGYPTEFSAEITLDNTEPYTFVCEVYALVVVHQYLFQEHSDIAAPFKYHLASQEKTGLDKLKISTEAPQFMGQDSSGLFYRLSNDQRFTESDVCWIETTQTFTQQVSCALESYIGRQDINLDTFSDIVMIPPRTIQRYLGREGSSFSRVKESLNMAFAKRVMIEREASISDIAEHLGYADTSQFIRAFKKSEKTTPLQWRKKASETHRK
ncbi:helix-turn-helix domain-containing protein [Vibrio sp. TBV020]|uniref:AraC family transcriptional regulator n=1 Tax=Vibrio sp. TBV020 TaxID=3137398 RepID=UPI0038CDC1F7